MAGAPLDGFVGDGASLLKAMSRQNQENITKLYRNWENITE